ncbi:MAG: CoA-binding protein [Candidatus Diapherotrites archaeon]|nr:CoA-binding protein [Candidatus Diapherotrites archaeon]
MEIKKRINLMDKSIAVIGASNNPEKFGFKVVKALDRITKRIFPVNPKEFFVLNCKAFKEVSDIKERIEIVNFVVPPVVSLSVISKIKNKNPIFWFQPGSFDKTVIEYCKKNNLDYIIDKCIIEESDELVKSAKNIANK